MDPTYTNQNQTVTTEICSQFDFFERIVIGNDFQLIFCVIFFKVSALSQCCLKRNVHNFIKFLNLEL